MTTRAGWIGLATGLLAAIVLVFPVTHASAGALLGSKTMLSELGFWLPVAATALLIMAGGWLAGRRSASAHPIRCAALGGLAGGLAGALIFCLLGAAAAGAVGRAVLPPITVGAPHRQQWLAEAIAHIVSLTFGTFLACFGGGTVLGLIGGRLACPHHHNRPDVFDKAAPQMALNAAITAVLASIAAAVINVVVFTSLADAISKSSGEAAFANTIVNFSLAVSLLLVLLSQGALTLVVPHEARQAEHSCGMDEVKMAAYVGMAAAPLLALLLLLVGPAILAKPLTIFALLLSAGWSLKMARTLFGLILPRRATLPVPPGWQKAEARWFGTIARSRGPRLVVLCLGCGIAMSLPLYVTTVAALVNLAGLMIETTSFPRAPLETGRALFLRQALISMGMVVASALALTAIYLFYLELGRWFSRRVRHGSPGDPSRWRG